MLRTLKTGRALAELDAPRTVTLCPDVLGEAFRGKAIRHQIGGRIKFRSSTKTYRPSCSSTQPVTMRSGLTDPWMLGVLLCDRIGRWTGVARTQPR